MSHFLDRLSYFSQPREILLRRPRRRDGRGPYLGGCLSQPLGARQDRALHARRELYRVMLVEDLRQGRHRHLGDAADRLPAHTLGHAQSRTTRLRPWCQLQLVPVQRQPGEVPDGSRSACSGAGATARCEQATRSRRGHRLSSPTPNDVTTRACAASAVLSARAGMRSTRSSPPPTCIRSRSTGRIG
jgi:hypothetical protein